jgi:hypothetical protein
VKGGKKVPKPIPVTLPEGVAVALETGATFSPEISTIEGKEDRPKKEKPQLNLF